MIKHTVDGLSVHDYFASMAMQTLMTDSDYDDQPYAVIAEEAYKMAAAMICERDILQESDD